MSEAMNYFTECENCGKEIEGVGEFDKEHNVLDIKCPNCGDEVSILDWEDEEEE